MVWQRSGQGSGAPGQRARRISSFCQSRICNCNGVTLASIGVSSLPSGKGSCRRLVPGPSLHDALPHGAQVTTARRTHGFRESVIRGMTRLAREYNAINLAQGFPNFPAPDAIKEAAVRAIQEDVNQYAI